MQATTARPGLGFDAAGFAAALRERPWDFGLDEEALEALGDLERLGMPGEEVAALVAMARGFVSQPAALGFPVEVAALPFGGPGEEGAVVVALRPSARLFGEGVPGTLRQAQVCSHPVPTCRLGGVAPGGGRWRGPEAAAQVVADVVAIAGGLLEVLVAAAAGLG